MGRESWPAALQNTRAALRHVGRDGWTHGCRSPVGLQLAEGASSSSLHYVQA